MSLTDSIGRSAFIENATDIYPDSKSKTSLDLDNNAFNGKVYA
jgi:hypothetical protein